MNAPRAFAFTTFLLVFLAVTVTVTRSREWKLVPRTANGDVVATDTRARTCAAPATAGTRAQTSSSRTPILIPFTLPVRDGFRTLAKAVQEPCGLAILR